jgi:hypothetical protein
MIDTLQLEKLYRSYGFEVDEITEEIAVFPYKKSRYFGVDIVTTNDSHKIQERAQVAKAKYSRIGYAVNLKKISTNEDAESELFKSFFGFDLTVERLKRKYREFANKQTKSLFGNTYEYVEAPFELQNGLNPEYGLFDVIKSKLTSRNAELIIIEAAAGYGKTCTAYEILNCLCNQSSTQIPIFTELSRNRSAKIFRYILLDEIDTEFSALNSELVIKEIKNGRIPLIVDGFDELLDKASFDTDVSGDSFEEVESMLNTIGNLLEHKCKVILTTRKTAIFTGLEFESWLSKWDNKFNLTRIALKEPRIKDWLGEDKFSLVKEKNVPIRYVANPVILTFLKNVHIDNFGQLLDNPEILVQQYFKQMLEREQERQNLLMSPEHQIDVFRNVVKMFIEFDIVAENKEFLKEIIYEQNKKLIEETRNLYGVDKPSVNNLLDTLATHALLDRKGRDQNQVGFINDFVLGTFVGQLMIEDAESKIISDYSAYMIETAITAFRVQNPSNKLKLWEKIQAVTDKFSIVSLFTFDIYLRESLVRDYSEISIYDLTFFYIVFSDKKISSSVFINCYFRNCVFDTEVIYAVSFVKCTFDNCKVLGDEFLDSQNGVTAIKCQQINCSILIEESNKYKNQEEEVVTDLEKEILGRLWSISHTKGHHIVKLFTYFEKNKRKEVSKSIKSLQEKELINVAGIHIYFDINKIPIIKSILGQKE